MEVDFSSGAVTLRLDDLIMLTFAGAFLTWSVLMASHPTGALRVGEATSLQLPVTIEGSDFRVVIERDEAEDRPEDLSPSYIKRGVRIRALDRRANVSRVMVFLAVDSLASPIQIRVASLYRDRLVISSRLDVEMFDLRKAVQVLSLRAQDSTISPTGQLLAAKLTGPRGWVGSEFNVLVLHMPTLSVRQVFPEELELDGPPELFFQFITEHGGANRAKHGEHLVGVPFWSPDGRWLIFGCTHGVVPPQEVRSFLVFVRLGEQGGVIEAKHQGIPRHDTIKEGPSPAQGRGYFGIETVRWLDSQTFVVTPPAWMSWVKPEIRFRLPEESK